MEKVYLTTPEGEIAIVKDKIVAVTECNLKTPDKSVLSRVYVSGDKDPFNILEDFQYVSNKI